MPNRLTRINPAIFGVKNRESVTGVDRYVTLINN